MPTEQELTALAKEPAWKRLVQESTIEAASDEDMCLVMGGILAGVTLWQPGRLKSAAKRALIQREELQATVVAMKAERDALKEQTGEDERAAIEL